MKFSALLHYVTPHRGTLLAIVLLLLASSAFSLATPWMAGQLTGLALGEKQVLFASMGWLFISWLGLITIQSGVGFVSSYLVGSTGEVMAVQLRLLADHEVTHRQADHTVRCGCFLRQPGKSVPMEQVSSRNTMMGLVRN